MTSFSDLFKWDRFITPSIIQLFYWLLVAIAVLFGLSGLFGGLAMVTISPIGALITIATSIIGALVGVLSARVFAEFVLIIFRINENLTAIRDRGTQI